jgi:GMP reductase
MSLKILDGVKLDFDDVLILPKRSVAPSRNSVTLERDFQFYHSTQTWNGFPLMCSNMYCTGTFEMAKELAKSKAITVLHKFYTYEQLKKFYDDNQDIIKYCWLSIGIRDEDVEKLKQISEYYHINTVLDVANGYTDNFTKACAKVREILGDYPILMAGNVCTGEMVQELILHGGVDIVKVGIGPGQFCETRKVTGIGFPQLSAIADCADAAHGLKSGDKKLGLICADGGLRMSSDICKAYGACADFAMLGTYLAGTEECQGEWIVPMRDTMYGKTNTRWVPFTDIWKASDKKNDECKLKFYGMSSDHAQKEHYGEKIPYAASEGKVGYVDYKGAVAPIIQEIQGALRSYCSYINAPTLKDAPKCTTFVRIR